MKKIGLILATACTTCLVFGAKNLVFAANDVPTLKDEKVPARVLSTLPSEGGEEEKPTALQVEHVATQPETLPTVHASVETEAEIDMAVTESEPVGRTAEPEQEEPLGRNGSQLTEATEAIDSEEVTVTPEISGEPDLSISPAEDLPTAAAVPSAIPFDIAGNYIDQAVTFNADKSQFSAEAKYSYILHRSSGARLKLSNQPSFTWVFKTIDDYRIELQVEDGGQVTSYFRTFAPTLRPLQIDSYDFSSSTIPNFEAFRAVGQVSGGAGEITFRHVLRRSNGQEVLLSTKPDLNWVFETPDNYSLTFYVEDAYGQTDRLTRNFRVQDSKPYFAEGNKTISVQAFRPFRYTPLAELGKGELTYDFCLSRSNGAVVGEWRAKRFDWTFLTADRYVVNIKATDSIGRMAEQQLNLPVYEPALSVNFALHKPTSSLSVYELLDFSAVSTGSYGKVNYRYILTRANGSEFQLSDKQNFSWLFLNPGRYKVTVYAQDELKRSASYEQTLNLQENPVRIVRFPVGRGEALQAYKPYNFDDLVVTGGYNRTYEYVLTRASGSRLLLHKGSKKDFSWRFTTPGQYKVTAIVSAGYGGEDRYTAAFDVLPDDPKIQLWLADKTVTERLTLFQSEVYGGGNVKDIEHALIRENGQRIFMGNNRKQLPWVFSTPGRYTYEVKVCDELGAYWTERQSFNVYPDRNDLPSLELSLGKNRILEQPLTGVGVPLNLDFDEGRYTKVAVFIAPRNMPAFVLAGDPYIPVRPVSKSGRTVYDLPPKFAAAGQYVVYAVGLDGVTGIECFAQSDLELVPNLPKVSGLYVNTGQHINTGNVIVTASVDPNFGVGPLRYSYYSYSWRYGKRHLGEFASARQTIPLSDTGVGAIGLEVKDGVGRVTPAGYFKTTFTGAWSFLSPKIRNTQNGNDFVLRWDAVPQADAYAVFRNGTHVATVREREYRGEAGLQAISYEIVPYYNLDGKAHAFSWSQANQIHGRGAFESIRIISNIMVARQRVVDIATAAEGRIPYGIDAKMDYSKTGYAAVTSRGLNCSGFVEWVFRTAGYTGAELGAWNWTASMMVNNPEISRSQLLPGDLGFCPLCRSPR